MPTKTARGGPSGKVGISTLAIPTPTPPHPHPMHYCFGQIYAKYDGILRQIPTNEKQESKITTRNFLIQLSEKSKTKFGFLVEKVIIVNNYFCKKF